VVEFSDVKQAAILQRSTAISSETKMLINRLQPQFPDVKFPVIQYGPALATHVGLSAMGVVVFESVP
jgi:hypothetical protein